MADNVSLKRVLINLSSPTIFSTVNYCLSFILKKIRIFFMKSYFYRMKNAITLFFSKLSSISPRTFWMLRSQYFNLNDINFNKYLKWFYKQKISKVIYIFLTSTIFEKLSFIKYSHLSVFFFHSFYISSYLDAGLIFRTIKS